MRAAGLVLAGGAGSRMGGERAKPLLEVGGRTLIGHAIGRLVPHCDPVLISANDVPAFAGLGHRVLPDLRAGRLGPLAGLEAACRHLAETRAEATHLLCLPGDTPFLPADLAQTLLRGAASRVRVATHAGRLHPTVALWPLGALAGITPELERADGARSLRAILERAGFDEVPFADAPCAPDGDPFFNVNTPADLARAQGCVNRHGRQTRSGCHF